MESQHGTSVLNAQGLSCIEWQVAGACNYDCSYCIQSPKHRRGRPDLQQVRAAIGWFSALPGAWEIKCSGGEAFAHPLFLAEIVPGLMRQTPHRISVLTNFSASREELLTFLSLTRGRLSVFSASLHLESVGVEAFVEKARWFVEQAAAQEGQAGQAAPVRFVVNQVVLPGRVAEAARCRALVEAAGLRWFPQLYKVKRPKEEVHPEDREPMTVAAYPPEEAAALAALLDRPGDRSGLAAANMAPSWRGRMCQAGVYYAVLDKDGELWSCRSAKRHRQGRLGSVFDGTARLRTAGRPCPYTICPCTVPANRGMIAGVGAGASAGANASANMDAAQEEG